MVTNLLHVSAYRIPNRTVLYPFSMRRYPFSMRRYLLINVNHADKLAAFALFVLHLDRVAVIAGVDNLIATLLDRMRFSICDRCD